MAAHQSSPMEQAQLVRISKFLSKHLRHRPEALGIRLEEGGWTSMDDLLTACRRKGFLIDRPTLERVVADNNKQRFSFDETRTRIRANQGHSVEVDLQLEPRNPPALLYHGTGHGSAGSIERTGIERRRRHHVHLSRDVQTANTVGARHGRPVVFEVDAAAMSRDGHIFYCSENGVWLTDNVPPTYLKRLANSVGASRPRGSGEGGVVRAK